MQAAVAAVQTAVQAAARVARAHRPRPGRGPGRTPGRRAARHGRRAGRRSAEVLEANAEDLRAARADGIRDALADRLRLRCPAGGHGRPAPRAGHRGRALAADDQGTAGRPAPGGVPASGRRDRGQLRGPPQRGGRHRLPVRQVAQRGRAAHGWPRSVRPSRWPTTSSRPRRPGRARPRDHPGGRRAPGRSRPAPGLQPAGPDPAGHPARQRQRSLAEAARHGVLNHATPTAAGALPG